ncbi:MAG: SLC26A/SulP transporter family protein, partial [Deltaproteobacteria bacterium]|nr:SLC26A/SulP transporter family protein [Deltaproteobacteria bacterium]
GSLVFRNIGSIGTLVVLSVIAFLLNSSGVEFIAGRDLEINRDLKATGVANLVSGIAGAPAGYVFISDTALATRMNARDRSVGILHGVFLLIVFFVGGAFLSFFPRFIAGGLPLYIGLSMLSEWLFDVRRSVPKVDHLIILTILLVVEFWGFLQGIGIGIGASVVIFVFRYSSIDLVKNVLDGSSVRSSKDRPITDQRLLDYNTDRILILSLQGFVFFGTANSLYEKVKRLTAASDKHIGFVLMDMGLVQGIDSSAVKSFEKLVRHLEEREIELLLVALPKKVRLPFEAAGFTGGEHGRVHYFVSLDHATEWCEDIIIKNECAKLMEEKEAGRKTGGDLFQAVYEDMMAALENQVLFESLMDRMTPYLERLEAVPGDILFRQKELCPDVYFILRGQVTLSRTNRSGERIRIRTLGPWTITGELGAFLGYRSPYEAEVVKEGVVFRLEAGRRKQMADEDPGLASDFQQLAIIMLGNQLMKTSRTIGERIQ